MRESLYQLHFRLGAGIQNLQRNTEIKYQGNKTAINKWANGMEEMVFKRRNTNG